MPPISKSGSLIELRSLSICRDTWTAMSEVSHVGSVRQVASPDLVSTMSREADNGSVGAKDDD